MVRLGLTTVYFGHAGAMVVSTLPSEIDLINHIYFNRFAADAAGEILFR